MLAVCPITCCPALRNGGANGGGVSQREADIFAAALNARPVIQRIFHGTSLTVSARRGRFTALTRRQGIRSKPSSKIASIHGMTMLTDFQRSLAQRKPFRAMRIRAPVACSCQKGSFPIRHTLQQKENQMANTAAPGAALPPDDATR